MAVWLGAASSTPPPSPLPLPAGSEIYFGPAPAGQAGGIDEGIQRFLSDTREQLVGALHELDVAWITDDLCRLARRGVRIHLAFEARYLGEEPNKTCLEKLTRAGVSVYPVKMPGLMHHKFLVSDRRRVLTGSANFTINCLYVNFNDLVRLDHPELADAYRDAFYRLIDPWSRRRPSAFPKRMEWAGGGHVSAWFSPGDPPPSEALLRGVEGAQSRLDFLIFAFSAPGISAEMSKAIGRKVQVRGIFDDAFESECVWKDWKALPFQWLWRRGADVKFDGREAKLHHKCLVVDDRAVFTGSFNFSTGADRRNAENLLHLEHPAFAAAYRSRIHELWNRFPDRTGYELFLQERKKNPGAFPTWSAWRSKRAATNRSPWVGRVEEVRTSGRLWVQASNHGAELTLLGCSFPEVGEPGFSQEPQASLCREGVARRFAMRTVRVEEYPGHRAWLRFLDAGNESNASLNEWALASGWALPSPSLPEGLDGDRRGRLATAATLATSHARGIHQTQPPLQSPDAFRAALEKRRLERTALERDLALPAFESNACIADRRKGNFAEPGQAAWSDRYRDLGAESLLFFRTPDLALKAGYRRCRDE
ncbi:MAG: hypothetical protein J0L75_14480 [Spirochaetes bacterium]|nr:hypothetical protein [Spirochaetota bacterium]